MAGKTRETPRRAAERFLGVILDQSATAYEKHLAMEGLQDIPARRLPLKDKQALVDTAVPQLVGLAEQVSQDGNPDAIHMRAVLAQTIRLASRQAAVGGLVRIRAMETDEHSRHLFSRKITELRSNLNATKHRQRKKAEMTATAG